MMIKEQEIPKQWELKTIQDIAEVILGNSPPGESYNKNGEGIPFIQGATAFGEITPETERCTSEPTKLCKEGDTIIATRATIGDLNKADKEYCLGRGASAVRAENKVNQAFLHQYLNSVNRINYWREVSTGSTFNSITKTNIQELEIPVPPLDEQERIVEAVEERLERAKRLEKSIQSVRQLSTEYEDSIMAYVFSDLDFDSKESAKNLPEAEDIPDSWELTTLGDMAHFQNGNGFSKSQWEEEGKPIIRIQNLTGTGDSYNYFSGEVHDRYAVENGDILFSWSGTIDAFRWTGGDAWLNQHIYRVDVEDGVEEKYLFYLLKRCANILEKRKVGGTLQHIRKGDITGLQVPLPPKQEQHNIVKRLESIDFSTLEKGVTDTNELLTEYRESILSRAFQDTPEADL